MKAIESYPGLGAVAEQPVGDEGHVVGRAGRLAAAEGLGERGSHGSAHLVAASVEGPAQDLPGELGVRGFFFGNFRHRRAHTGVGSCFRDLRGDVGRDRLGDAAFAGGGGGEGDEIGGELEGGGP